MKDQLKEALAAVKNGEEVRARAIVAGLLKEQPDNVAGWVLLSKLAENEVQKTAFLHKVIALDPGNEYATGELSLLQGEEVAERTEPVVTEAEAEAGKPATVTVGDPEETTLQPAPEAEVAAPPEEAFEGASVAAPTTELPTRELEAEETKEIETPAVPDEPFDYEAQAEGETLPPWLEDDEIAPEPKPSEELSLEETAPPADLPDWLQEEPEEEWTGEVEGEVTPTVADIETAPVVQKVEAAGVAKPRTKPETESESSISWVTIGLGILLILIFLAFIYALLTLL